MSESQKKFTPRRYDGAAGAGNYPIESIPDGWEPAMEDGCPAQFSVGYITEQRVLAAIVMAGGQVIVGGRGKMNARLARLAAGDISTDQVARALRQLQAKKIVHLDLANPDNIRGRWVKGVYLLDGERKADQWAMDELRKLLVARREDAEAKPAPIPAGYVPERPNQPKIVVAPTAKSDGLGTALPPAKVLPRKEPAVVLESVTANEITGDPEPEPEAQAEPGDLSALADQLLINAGRAISERNRLSQEVTALRDEISKLRRQVSADTGSSHLRDELKTLRAQFDEAKRYAYDLEQERNSLRATITQQDKNVEQMINTCREQQEELDRLRARLRRQNESDRREYKLREQLDPASRAALQQAARPESTA